jgi:predicted nucleic-acid-binding protein
VIADTNVLLRALDPEDRPHAQAVRARIETARSSGAKLTVLAATVLEVAYVLESARAGYGWDRKGVARAIEAIIYEPGFDVEHGEAIADALSTYRTRSIDLHDCFLGSVATQRHTRVLSFDDDLRKLGVSEKP